MALDMNEETRTTVYDTIKGARDALTVKRVFGDPYELGDLKVIPVARVAGGAGGGGGEGTKENEDGRGFGSGFGMGAHPVGVYEVHGDHTEWRPAVDVNRVIKGGQVLAGIVAVCVTIILWSRRPR